MNSYICSDSGTKENELPSYKQETQLHTDAIFELIGLLVPAVHTMRLWAKHRPSSVRRINTVARQTVKSEDEDTEDAAENADDIVAESEPEDIEAQPEDTDWMAITTYAQNALEASERVEKWSQKHGLNYYDLAQELRKATILGNDDDDDDLLDFARSKAIREVVAWRAAIESR